jgi:hypothetical protein
MTPAFVTPNLWVECEVNDGVRDQIARTLIEFGFTPKGRARSYQKPYPEYFDVHKIRMFPLSLTGAAFN